MSYLSEYFPFGIIDYVFKYLTFNSVQGPVNLFEMKKSDSNLQIYLFSDIHVYTESCFKDDSIKIEDLLASIFNQQPKKTFDFFTEKSSVSPKNKFLISKDSHISRVLIKFESCFETRCQYDNVRFHWSEVRNLPYFSDLEQKIKEQTSLILNKSEILNQAGINQELKKIDDLKIQNLIQNVIDHDFESFEDQPETILTQLVDWVTLIQILQNPKIKNVIIFYGGTHINNLVRILSLFGFKIINQVGKDTDLIINQNQKSGKDLETFIEENRYQCLNISSFKFFV